MFRSSVVVRSWVQIAHHHRVKTGEEKLDKMRLSVLVSLARSWLQVSQNISKLKRGDAKLNFSNWKRLTLISLILASKIWDDDSLENVHFP